MALPERWNSRLRTAAAMAALCQARLAVAILPFSWWRDGLGRVKSRESGQDGTERARRYAAHVEWAARLVPFPTKCLPRAMAVSWLLSSDRIAHSVVFAVRPAAQRLGDDQLHAWVEVAGSRIIGDLPGPWVETLRLGDSPPAEINKV